MKLLFLFALSLFNINTEKVDPPEPEIGKRWILNLQYSDEFNGTTLDQKKWRNSYNGWKGRSPGYFSPNAVSVKSGMLQIKNGILDKSVNVHTKKKYSIKGGAVQSLEKTAHYGYYEVNFKASRINMSTTFWMSNRKVPINFATKMNNANCSKDKFSQELDIVESIGGVITAGDKFRKNMNFNTHYRYIDCNGGKEKFYSAGNNAIEGSGLKSSALLSSESWEEFHTYGAYWKNANEVAFYANNNFVGNVNISTDVVNKPFPRTMGINMVTETYDWALPYPTNEELNNDSINTSYYNWVRSYKLVDIDAKSKNKKKYKGSGTSIYKEEVSFFNTPTIENKQVIIPYTYKANTDKKAVFKIINDSNKVVYKTTLNLLSGYGKNIKTLDFKKENTAYTFKIEFIE